MAPIELGRGADDRGSTGRGRSSPRGAAPRRHAVGTASCAGRSRRRLRPAASGPGAAPRRKSRMERGPRTWPRTDRPSARGCGGSAAEVATHWTVAGHARGSARSRRPEGARGPPRSPTRMQGVDPSESSCTVASGPILLAVTPGIGSGVASRVRPRRAASAEAARPGSSSASWSARADLEHERDARRGAAGHRQRRAGAAVGLVQGAQRRGAAVQHGAARGARASQLRPPRPRPRAIWTSASTRSSSSSRRSRSSSVGSTPSWCGWTRSGGSRAAGSRRS